MKTLRILILAALFAFAATNTLSQPLPDPFEVFPGSNPGGTTIRPGTGLLPPLPADFFGPGSDPFTGAINLQGPPLGGNQFGTGAALVQRPGQPVTLPDSIGSYAEIPIEIVALDLVTTEPIIVTYGGIDPEEWDVRLLPSSVPPPEGIQAVTKEHVNGGTFESILYVQPTLVFTRLLDGMVVIWDTGLESIDPLELGMEGPWVHVLSPTLEIIAPSDGFYVPGVHEDSPGIPESQCPEILYAADGGGAFDLTLRVARLVPPEDPWVVMPGPGPDGTCLEFGAGDNPPIPADFFGPGSDPFEGQVCVHGEPLGPVGDPFEDAETLILRVTDPFDSCELPSPDPRNIGIEIVDLRLASIDPIEVTYGGSPPEFWDVFTTIGPPSLPPLESADDKITATKTHINGGTFDIAFSIQPIYTFMRIPDGEMRVLDTGLDGLPPLVFAGTDGYWVHDVDPSLFLVAPSDGKFVPGVEEIPGGGRGSQHMRLLHTVELSGAGTLTLASLQWDPTGLPRPVQVRPSGVTVSAYPNPFHPLTTIQYNLPARGRLNLEIYNVRGELVRRLRDDIVEAGPGAAIWNGRDSSGRHVTGGVYFYRLTTNGVVSTGKMVMVR